MPGVQPRDQMPEHYSRDEHHAVSEARSLLHGGAHKTNQVLGQALLASGWVKLKLLPKPVPVSMAWRGPCQRPARPEMPYLYGCQRRERQSPNVFRMRLMGAEVIPGIAVPRP